MTSIQYLSLRVFLAFLSTQDPYNHPYDHSPSTRVPLWGIIFQYLIPLFCKISVLGYPYEKVFTSTWYPCLKSFQNLGILRKGVFQFLVALYFVFIFRSNAPLIKCESLSIFNVRCKPSQKKSNPEHCINTKNFFYN